MGVTIKSVFSPLNQYFIQKYQSDTDIFFRFDRIAASVSENDFNNPAFIHDISKRDRTFSEIVNGMLLESEDDIHVMRSSDSLGSFYKTILDGAQFALQDHPDTEILFNSFNKSLGDANRIWDTGNHAGSGPLEFPYCKARPENWIEQDSNSWTKHSLKVKDEKETKGEKMMWRIKLDDAALSQLIAKKGEEAKKPEQLHHRVMLLKKTSPVFLSAAALAESGTTRFDRRTARTGTLRSRTAIIHRAGLETAVAAPERTIAVQSKFKNLLKGLNLTRRYEVTRFIKEGAQVQPSESNEINIEFEFCLVGIERPWLHKNFLYNKTWRIPLEEKGSFSQKGKSKSFTVLPIAFLAVRNLNIKAQWTEQDIANAQIASDFGPFEVNSGFVENKLSHPGIQIIGWICERMPELPPVTGHT